MTNRLVRGYTPLATLAIFTYNQEEYVREAVNAAFAQTYQPIEIILSDDCSTDNTYNILQKLTAEYVGPHRVTVRQTPKNMGTFLHVLDVARIAQGGLLVLSSGDDVSKPNRVAALVEAWESSGAWGLHSTFDRIDESGKVLSREDRAIQLLDPDYTLRKYFFLEDGEVGIVHGTVSAYDKQLFNFIDTSCPAFVLSEDGALSLLLNLLNKKVKFVDQSLVCYRSHSGSLTNGTRKILNPSISSIVSDLKKSAVYDLSCKNRAELLLKWSDSIPFKDKRRLNTEYVLNDVFRFLIRSEWFEIGQRDRFRYFFDKRMRGDLKWMLLRLFGMNFFIINKLAVKKLHYLISKLIRDNASNLHK